MIEKVFEVEVVFFALVALTVRELSVRQELGRQTESEGLFFFFGGHFGLANELDFGVVGLFVAFFT